MQPYRFCCFFFNVMLQKLKGFLLQKLRGRHYIFYSWELNSTKIWSGMSRSSCSIWWHCNETEECPWLLCICYPSPSIQGPSPSKGHLFRKTLMKERELNKALWGIIAFKKKQNKTKRFHCFGRRCHKPIRNCLVYGMLGLSFSQRKYQRDRPLHLIEATYLWLSFHRQYLWKKSNHGIVWNQK